MPSAASRGGGCALFVLLTVDMMTRVNKAPKRPLLLAIDEFPSLGRLDGIETVAPTMRSQGVRLWVIGQDIEQFEKVYPDSWARSSATPKPWSFLGVTHPPTVAFLAEDWAACRDKPAEWRGQFRDVSRNGRSVPDQTRGCWRGGGRARTRSSGAAASARMLLKIAPIRVHAVVVLLQGPAFPESLTAGSALGPSPDGGPPGRPPHGGPPHIIRRSRRRHRPNPGEAVHPRRIRDASYIPEDADPKRFAGTRRTWNEAVGDFRQRQEIRQAANGTGLLHPPPDNR